MVIMNLFVGIIMSSMSEMHEEMAVRDRAKHIEETGSITLEDELRALERQMETLQGQLRNLRHRAAHST